MSHELETSIYVGRTPWHGLGIFVGDEDIDSKTAIIKAGLNWTVEKQRLFTSTDGINVSEILNHKAIIRDFDKSQFGIVKNDYEIIQNLEAFEFMDSLVEDGSMRYHTAGSLRGGKRIWLLGKVGNIEVVPNDHVDNYLLLYNTHDSSSPLRVLFTNVRVVCANTAQVALNKGRGQGISVRHTKNIKTRMIQAKEILGFAKNKFADYSKIMKTLAKIQISATKWDEMINKIIPNPPADIISKSMITKRQNVRDDITKLFYEGVGQDIPLVAGTGWAAYNAVIEYANYYKRTRGKNRGEKRFESTFFGTSAKLINNAQKEILKLAA